MKSWGGRRGNPSQKLVLAKMHSLDYVSAVVEHPSNVLRVYCACKVWITVVFTISAGCADSLQKERRKKNVNSLELCSIRTHGVLLWDDLISINDSLSPRSTDASKETMNPLPEWIDTFL